jgi:hypothetical protein
MCYGLVAQDLDPRAYVWLPVKMTTIVGGFAYSHGEVVTDPTLPLENINAKVQAASVSVAHTFGLFGLSAQALVAMPWSWAQVSGEVGNQLQEVTRSGTGDMRLRLSVLLLGAPAANVGLLAKAPRKTILGFSLNAVAPTGEFLNGKLINLGTNRWAFRPELALSQPFGSKWLADFYTGIWLFTDNQVFYPGDALREQAPMGTFQGHLSYNIKPGFWLAINSTYYVGGQSTINNKESDDRQSNFRLGFTGVLPTGKFSSLRLSASTGAVVRVGQDFTTYSIGWQRSWIKGLKKKAG